MSVKNAHPCRLQPLADHVVVLPTPVADVTAGGIVKPDSAKEVPVEGTVLAVGPGRRPDRPVSVQRGQTVLFGRYAGCEVQLDGQRVLIMREADLLGVLG